MVSLVKQNSFPKSIAPLTPAEVKFFQSVEKFISRNDLQHIFDFGKTKAFKTFKFCLKSTLKVEKILENLPAYYALWLYWVQNRSSFEIKDSCSHTETAVQAQALFMAAATLAVSAKSCKILMRTYKSLGSRYASFVNEKIPAGGDLACLVFGKNEEQALIVRKLLSASYLVYAISLGAKVFFNNGLINTAINVSKTATTIFKGARQLVTVSRGLTKLWNELQERKTIVGTTDEAVRNKLIKKHEEKSAKQSFFYAKTALHLARFTCHLFGTRLLHPLFSLNSAYLNVGKSVRSKEDKQLKIQKKEKAKNEKASETKVVIAVNRGLALKDFSRIFLLCAAIIFIAHTVFFKTERYDYCRV